MASSTLYRRLVPDAPRHRRTERDTYPSPEAERRARLAARLARPEVVPGLQAPRLVSSWEGTIEHLLLAFPAYGVDEPPLEAAYRSLLAALRPGTRFTVVHHRSRRLAVEKWFADAGHAAAEVTYVALPDYVSFTDWAEDGYAAVLDGADGSAYLMEPWEFPRAGDALIAEAVQEHLDLRAAQAPLVFQGGNCLIGDDFWLLGKDYFADSVALVEGERPPVDVPPGTTTEAFVSRLFADYVDAGRQMVVLGTRRPIPVRDLYGRREGDEYYLDIAGDGAGTYQPIFHIDMFVTLVGRQAGGSFLVLVGDPALGDERLGTTSPYALADVYDALADQLAARGLRVERNPLVHRPTLGARFTLAELRQIAAEPGNEVLLEPIADLEAAGATDATGVRVRTWHHVTWNNCLVENCGSGGRHVYLPTFGHGRDRDLASLDAETAALWERLGFTVHLLGDFNPFARRQGLVHCIKKYLARGERPRERQ